jgi:hypothetical protein
VAIYHQLRVFDACDHLPRERLQEELVYAPISIAGGSRVSNALSRMPDRLDSCEPP